MNLRAQLGLGGWTSAIESVDVQSVRRWRLVSAGYANNEDARRAAAVLAAVHGLGSPLLDRVP